MRLDVDENGIVVLSRFFSGILLRTTEGNEIGVCPRDNTFEISVGGRWWRVNMAEQSIEELPSFCEHREWSARKHGDACPECQAPMSMEANHGQEVEG